MKYRPCGCYNQTSQMQLPLNGNGTGVQHNTNGYQYMQTPMSSTMPSIPTTPSTQTTGIMPLQTATPTTAPMMIAPPGEQAPQTVQSTLYTPGYLRTQIGKTMRVEFLIGSNGPLVDRIGVLISVGVSYILLRPIETDDILLCDLYSIKFVTIMY